jgi:hypothetical protein
MCRIALQSISHTHSVNSTFQPVTARKSEKISLFAAGSRIGSSVIRTGQILRSWTGGKRVYRPSWFGNGTNKCLVVDMSDFTRHHTKTVDSLTFVSAF